MVSWASAELEEIWVHPSSSLVHPDCGIDLNNGLGLNLDLK